MAPVLASVSAPVFRFAPSPTGYIHIGNARTALWNALLAKKLGGTFLLRFDDTDIERSKKEYVDAIIEDLSWLGLTPDRIFHQSDRIARYQHILDLLKEKGAIYPAYETAEELERKRKRQQARGLPPVYDRAALALTTEERTKLEAEGRLPHWRFRLSGQNVVWEDGIRGASHIETSSLSDPVVVRADGTFLYTFASVIDDLDTDVTDILRGEDHVTNTAVQIELFTAIMPLIAAEGKKLVMPRFAHHNLIASANGEEMSKRTGALSIRSFRQDGVDPLSVAIVAVLTGTSEPTRPLTNIDELAHLLAYEKFSRALTKFSPDEIRDLSARLLHVKPFELVAPELEKLGIKGEKAALFWRVIAGNLATLEDAQEWWQIFNQPRHFLEVDPISAEDAAFFTQACACLPPAPFDENTWVNWTKQLSAQTGRKGKTLFMPLRLALTGRESGPELKVALPLLSREECLTRLTPRLNG